MGKDGFVFYMLLVNSSFKNIILDSSGIRL